MKTKYEANQVVQYDPVGQCGELCGGYAVRVVRNGWLFVKVQDRMTGMTFDALRWELKPL